MIHETERLFLGKADSKRQKKIAKTIDPCCKFQVSFTDKINAHVTFFVLLIPTLNRFPVGSRAVTRFSTIRTLTFRSTPWMFGFL